MIDLELFILGLISGLFIQPILESFTSLILSFIEMIKAFVAIPIAKSNKKIQDISDDNPIKSPIGFALEEEEVESNDGL